MASPQSQPFLAERVDVHKACKSLETLLNVLNDYCEAAGAVVLLQKKLAKALREASSQKVTGEIASNAMNASATIFEALSDIDSKFAKIADKEYDGISGEVKKWFKKLAKEEKAHDDRLSSANAKIKQAGQLYEKKSKKNPRDSADEHARYINLISTLGPEISQEKYNHTLQVTQRHVATTYSVAACLSRIADAEWLRTCEGVRRFSPTIGPLGEWRALCEGGWTGAVPPSLVDPDPETQPMEQETRTEQLPNTVRNLEPPSYERDQTPSITPLSSPKPPRSQLPPPSSFEPPRPLVDPNSGSVRSLSAFPLPPAHFPIPSRQQLSQQGSSSSSASNSNGNFPTSQFESTLLEPDRQVDEPSSGPSSPNQSFAERRPPADSLSSLQEELEIQRPIPVRSQTADSYQPNLSRIPSPTADHSTPRPFPRGNYVADERGSVPKQGDVPDWVQSKPGVQRSDTGGSNGSIVAAMRNRYSGGSASKDIPRLPLSVGDLATRYQPGSAPTSPQGGTRAGSPVIARTSQQPSSPERYSGERNAPAAYGRPLPSPSTSKLPDDALQRRNQQLDQTLDEAAELEFLEKERVLEEREREISLRAKELELERANMRNLRGDTGQRESLDGGSMSPKPQLRPRERKTSFRTSPIPRPQSQLETRSPQPPYVGNTHAHSYSTTHLVPPPASQSQHSSSSPRSSTSSADGTGAHAISCGCESCSVQHYTSPSNRAPSPHDLRPPEKPFALRTEKPKGWIRRLSMPVAVGNAFSLDKKNTGSPKMYSLDGGKRGANGSATALRNVDEEGRMAGRRSYDANRSTTSLLSAPGRR